MKLSEVTVQNYRSINRLTKFSVDDITTLIGPNNEGKSNLLRALALGMEIIDRWSFLPDRLASVSELSGVSAMQIFRRRSLRGGSANTAAENYSWSRDYPIHKQETRGSHPTLIRLRFTLTEDEMREFQGSIGIQNNGDLPIEIKLGRGSASFGIVKPGKGAATHRKKAREIARFVSSHISFVSIPAIRTGQQAQALVNDLARLRLRTVVQSDEYIKLATQLNALRNTAVESIAVRLTASVKRYLPSVNEIQIETADIERADAVDDLLIDDGVLTSIENKGDGIKSLVAMALIQELAQRGAERQAVILAVDEPEAHLHSRSVHELQTLFQQLSLGQQVIVATHNPIFVNRQSISANILVVGNEAKPARSVKEIRDSLGVRLYDNLDSAEIVVLVEGITDEVVLPIMLTEVDSTLEARISTGQLVFKATHGTGKTRAQVQREKSTLCRIVVVLDSDDAGKREAAALSAQNLIDPRNIFLLGESERRLSEIEDLVRPQVYIEALNAEFGRSFDEKMFANRQKKWSTNFESAAIGLGIAFAPPILDRAKEVVSNAVRASESVILKSKVVSRVESLAELLAQSFR